MTTERLTEEQIAELERLECWPRPWRTDTDTEGEEAMIVADNAAYPDEQAVLAEVTDACDARAIVAAVNALPSLLAEVRAHRAAPVPPPPPGPDSHHVNTGRGWLVDRLVRAVLNDNRDVALEFATALIQPSGEPYRCNLHDERR